MHHNYPHEAGRLIGCPACDLTCNCNHAEVEAGREEQCVWIGHEDTERLALLGQLSVDELSQLAESAAAVEHDGYYAMLAIEKYIASRGLAGQDKKDES